MDAFLTVDRQNKIKTGLALDATDDVIPWNFTKFLITRGGKLARRFAPNAAPESLESQIRELLSEESLHDRTG